MENSAEKRVALGPLSGKVVVGKIESLLLSSSTVNFKVFKVFLHGNESEP